MIYIGYACAALVIGLLLFNGICMLISPRYWFSLPPWLGATASLDREKYSNGLMSETIRLTGLAILCGIGWCCYDISTH